MSDREIRCQDGRFQGTTRIGEASNEGDVENISEVQFDGVGRQRVGESMEGLLRTRFLVPQKCDDFVDRTFVDDPTRCSSSKRTLGGSFILAVPGRRDLPRNN